VLLILTDLAVYIARNVTILQIGPQSTHPFLQPRGNRDPDTVLGIAQHEVDLADRLAIDAVRQHARVTVSRHDLQTVRAEIRNQDVAIGSKGESVWQSSFQIAPRFVPGAGDTFR